MRSFLLLIVLCQINLDVRVPVPPLPLSSSKKESVWSYELKIEQLDGQQAVIHEKCLRQLGHIKDELTMLGKDCFGKVEGVQRPFTMEVYDKFYFYFVLYQYLFNYFFFLLRNTSNFTQMLIVFSDNVMDSM